MASNSYNNFKDRRINSKAEEKASAHDISDAINELSRTVCTLNRSLLKLQQQVADLASSDSLEVISIPKTLH